MNFFKSKIIKNNKSINLGIQILRIILSFLIVIVHCHGNKKVDIKLLKFSFRNLCFYVPTFFIISSYFSYNIFSSRNIIRIKERFLRILIPYIIWSIIFWIEYIIDIYLKGKKCHKILKKLYYQLLIGCDLYGIFWYLFNLILISIFIIIIIIMFKKNNLFLMQILYIIIFIYDYLGYNNYIFLNYSLYVNHSIKPIFKSLFYSLSGYFLGSINILNKFKKYRILVMIIILFAFIYFKNNIMKVKIIPFVFKIDLVCVNIFIIFGMIPFDKLNQNIQFIINKISFYTGGVYYLHVKTSHFLKSYFNLLKFKDLKGCIIIYFITYFICFLGSIIFRKSKFRYLFI